MSSSSTYMYNTIYRMKLQASMKQAQKKVRSTSIHIHTTTPDSWMRLLYCYLMNHPQEWKVVR